jgi:transposase
VGVSAGGVASVVSRATHKGLTWEAVTGLTDDQLEETLWGPKLPLSAARSLPDPVHIHTELRGDGVTLELLHLEYLATYPNGLRYSAFCGHYRRWVALQRCSMRQVHKAGEKLFVDYAGQHPHLVDPRTGEQIDVELFVAVLGASNYTYAEATLTQRVPDFLASHTRAVEYLGGLSRLVVPDQLRTGVSDPCRYEPGVQRSYADWARHYGTVILPARPAKPRDKAQASYCMPF